MQGRFIFVIALALVCQQVFAEELSPEDEALFSTNAAPAGQQVVVVQGASPSNVVYSIDSYSPPATQTIDINAAYRRARHEARKARREARRLAKVAKRIEVAKAAAEQQVGDLQTKAASAANTTKGAPSNQTKPKSADEAELENLRSKARAFSRALLKAREDIRNTTTAADKAKLESLAALKKDEIAERQKRIEKRKAGREAREKAHKAKIDQIRAAARAKKSDVKVKYSHNITQWKMDLKNVRAQMKSLKKKVMAQRMKEAAAKRAALQKQLDEAQANVAKLANQLHGLNPQKRRRRHHVTPSVVTIPIVQPEAVMERVVVVDPSSSAPVASSVLLPGMPSDVPVIVSSPKNAAPVKLLGASKAARRRVRRLAREKARVTKKLAEATAKADSIEHMLKSDNAFKAMFAADSAMNQ